jgi:hypothetical protein
MPCYVPNHKERKYLVTLTTEFAGLGPERVANSVAIMNPDLHVASVRDLTTMELVEFAGRCRTCKSWIRKADKFLTYANGLDCGECKSGGIL